MRQDRIPQYSNQVLNLTERETDMSKQMDVSGTKETIINRRNRGQLIENNWKRYKLCSKGNVVTRLGG